MDRRGSAAWFKVPGSAGHRSKFPQKLSAGPYQTFSPRLLGKPTWRRNRRCGGRTGVTAGSRRGNATRRPGGVHDSKGGRRSARERPLRGGGLLENQLVALDGDLDGVVFVEVTLEDFLGQGVLQVALDRTAHGPGAVNRVVTLLHEEILRLLVEVKLDVPALQPFHDLLDLQIQNLDQVRLVQGAENNHVVEPVQEFPPERLLGFIENLFLHLLVAALLPGGGKADGGLFADRLRAHV